MRPRPDFGRQRGKQFVETEVSQGFGGASPRGGRAIAAARSPGGVFTVSRWYNPNDIRETARLLSLAAASLRLRGVANPETHVFLACTPRLATIIVANATFSADELAKLRDATTEVGFTGLVSPAQAAASPVLAQAMQATSANAFARLARSYRIDLTPPTDDRPFFFNQLLLTDFASIEEARSEERRVGKE